MAVMQYMEDVGIFHGEAIGRDKCGNYNWRCPMSKVNLPIAKEVLGALNDGLYVTDTERRILYWNKSAERITGWSAEEVTGHSCKDNILVHIDKDGRCLCQTDFCPLHRCMVTDRMSSAPLLVFAQTRTGGRVPVFVSCLLLRFMIRTGKLAVQWRPSRIIPRPTRISNLQNESRLCPWSRTCRRTAGLTFPLFIIRMT